MKRLLLIAAIALIGGSLNAHEGEAIQQKETVYICTGSSATTYHAIKTCRGLSACKGSIKELTKEQAESMKRRPCKICYK